MRENSIAKITFNCTTERGSAIPDRTRRRRELTWWIFLCWNFIDLQMKFLVIRNYFRCVKHWNFLFSFSSTLKRFILILCTRSILEHEFLANITSHHRPMRWYLHFVTKYRLIYALWAFNLDYFNETSGSNWGDWALSNCTVVVGTSCWIRFGGRWEVKMKTSTNWRQRWFMLISAEDS